jgi:hypothetical protein
VFPADASAFNVSCCPLYDVQAQLADRENQLSQAQKAAAAAATEVQLARDALAAAQSEKKEELAALRQQHEAAVEQVSGAAVSQMHPSL